MAGFKYLFASSAIIAVAFIMGTNIRHMDGDLSFQILLSLEGICSDEQLNDYLPFVIDCRFYQDVRVTEFGSRSEILQFGDGNRIELNGTSGFVSVGN